LGLAKALLWPLSGPELLRETKNRSWQRRPKATGLLLARRDALGEINVKVLRSPLTANQSELNIRPMSFSEALYARETFSIGSHARRSLFLRASRPPRVDQTQNPFSRKLAMGSNPIIGTLENSILRGQKRTLDLINCEGSMSPRPFIH
jgi:hypothetical protein